MQSYCGFTKETKTSSYCPDYINRKKGDKEETLENFLNNSVNLARNL